MDDRATVSVTVSKASGTPTGSVVALLDGKVVGAGELSSGKALIELQPFETVGTKSIQVRYFGDDTTKPATSTASLDVVKSTPKLKVKAPKKGVKGKKVTISVTVSATGYTPTGKVSVKVNGKKVTKSLNDGTATFKVRLTKVGKNKVKVAYAGDARTVEAKDSLTIKATRR